MIKRRALQRTSNDISLADLRRHLSDNGWKPRTTSNEKFVAYQHTADSSGELELILPTSERFSDFGARISDAINALSQIEGKPTSQLANEIRAINHDSFRVRLAVKDDAISIPLSNAPQHIKGIRNLFLYSYCSEIQIEKHFEVPLGRAISQLSNCQFGHTFRGSFGFEVSSKLLPPDETPDLFGRPISRRAVERIIRGFQYLSKATSKEDPDILVDAYEEGFNARMCEALSDIGFEGETSYDCEVSWASGLAPSQDVKSFRTIHLGEAEIGILASAASQLKAVKGQTDSIVGTVINLHCARNPSDDTSKRVVAIKVRHDIFGPIEVRIQLGTSRYLKAVEAHTSGSSLSIRGVLERKGSIWSMDSITRFERIS